MFEKLKMQSPDLTAANIDKIAALFPNCVTEKEDADGKITRGINFERLKQELSADVIEHYDECYDFTWVGKNAAIAEGNEPAYIKYKVQDEKGAVIEKKTPATLRPCMEESKNWEDTENLYIEGDNLTVLKLLQESYLNSIKMIYIDPPYNTGKDFIYKDNRRQTIEEYEEEIGMRGEDGMIQFTPNLEANPQYHSDWCSMMYPRLRLAKNLLTEDGVIFISIDDNEVHNMRKICDEVFGEGNFVADLVWANKEGGGSSDSKLFRIKHEHILCYSKSIEAVNIIGVPVGNEERYKSLDEYVATRGKYYLQKMGMGTIQYSISLDYPIECPDGTTVMPADNNSGRKACWRWSKPKYEWGVVNGFIEIKKDSSGIWTVYSKQYLNCDNEGNIIARTQRPMGIIEEYSSTQASKLLETLELGSYFNYSKPVDLLRWLIRRVDTKNSIILDFFSGSATTAHAVMQLNAEDGGNRKFIMVQLPEPCDEKSEAFKAGYKTICEIGKERIRRAGEKIQSGVLRVESGVENQISIENNSTLNSPNSTLPLDIGFRVFKTDTTNMKDVYYAAGELTQVQLDELVSNIKEDRSDLDLLYGVLIDWGLPLSMKHKIIEIEGIKIHDYDDLSLVACFADNVSETLVREIAKMQPLRVVFKDGSFESSPHRLNVEEIFKLNAPKTSVKVI